MKVRGALHPIGNRLNFVKVIMTLEQHISKLLFSNDCVVVPGFGAFMAKSFSAEMNNATQMFVPPGRRLSFQPALRSDDGLLLKEIARRENRHHDVVRLEVSDKVSSWHSVLHRGEKVRLDNLGLFYIDRQGELQFKPQIDVNFDSKYFGLGVFRATPIIEIPEERRVIPLNERKDRKRVPMWRAVAVAVGVTGLLAIGGMKSGYDFSMPDLAGFNWLNGSSTEEVFADDSEEVTDAVAEEQAEESLRSEIVEEQPVQETQVEEAPTIELNTQDVAVSPVEAGVYYVVVGSFVEKANADDLYRELEAKGYEPHVLPFDGKYTKVAIASFSNRQAATQQLRQYRQQVQRGAWIYRK